LEVIKHHEANGVCAAAAPLVVERSFAWAARFRRLARDYERLASTLAGYHWLAFVSSCSEPSLTKVHDRL